MCFFHEQNGYFDDRDDNFNDPRKKHPRLGARYQMEIKFPSDESKKDFLSRLERAKSLLSSRQKHNVNKFSLLASLLVHLLESEQDCSSSADNASVPVQPMMRNSGKFTSNIYRKLYLLL